MQTMPIETAFHIFENEIRDWHSHDRHQLLYAYDGVMRIEVAGAEWVLPPQRGVWIAKGDAHKFTARRRIDFRTIYFDEVPIDRPTGVFTVPPLLRQLIDYIVSGGPSQGKAVDLLLDLVGQTADAGLATPALSDPRLRRVQAQVIADMSEGRSLEQIATQVGASARTLSRLFHNEVQMSFNLWRRQIRMLTALELLGEGQSVTQVAFAVGYNSSSSFSTAFSDVFGVSPKGYFDTAS